MKWDTVLEAVASCAALDPTRVALVHDGEEWSYRQLWALINLAVDEIYHAKLPAQACVAVVARKSPATIALLIALGLRKHTPLAISPDIGHLVKPALFSQAGIYCELAAEFHLGMMTVEVSSQDLPVSSVTIPADCPLMLTTSGSTGIPKVVALDNDAVCKFTAWAANYFAIDRQSRVLSYAPLNFDLSLLEVWVPLALGACVILTNPAKATNLTYLQNLIRTTKPQLVQGVPMFYSLLCDGVEAEPMSSVFTAKDIIFTGDFVSQELRKKTSRLFPTATFHNIYGCTETNDSFVFSSPAKDVELYEKLPLGFPIQDCFYRISDDAGDFLTGPCEGELHVSTPFMAKGYSCPEKTNLVFYWDEVEKRRYYRSGDRVYLDEQGVVHLVGRNDHVVKIRGVRTNLQDIEHVIRLADVIQDVVVVPIDDEIAGINAHAVIIIKQGKKFDGISLRMLCAHHLPLTSVPRRFHLYEEDFPRTSTGKPDRRLIAQFVKNKEFAHA